MSDPTIDSILPESLSDLLVVVENYKGEKTDITGIVTEISIYESIFNPFLYGEVILIDGTDAFNDIPFIGQEKLEISWKRDEINVQKTFRVTNVYNITKAQESFGAYGLTITAEEQLINSISLFSKAYQGRSDEIVDKIYEEFFDREIDFKVEGKTKHSIVFPYLKPFQAINMILKNTLCDDNSPMFLFDSMVRDDDDDKLFFESFNHMFRKPAFYTIEQKKNLAKTLNKNVQGIELAMQKRGSILQEFSPKAFDTLDNIINGSFASKATILDASIKRGMVQIFDEKEDFEPASNSYISDNFKINELGLNELPDTKHMTIVKNSKAFEDEEFPNLNTVDDMDKQILQAWKQRLFVITTEINMDSINYLLDSKKAFRVGKTVNYNASVMKTKFDANDRKYNKLISGKYLISNIRHYIKNGKYTMSIELIRDGMNEEVIL